MTQKTIKTIALSSVISEALDYLKEQNLISISAYVERLLRADLTEKGIITIGGIKNEQQF